MADKKQEHDADGEDEVRSSGGCSSVEADFE